MWLREVLSSTAAIGKALLASGIAKPGYANRQLRRAAARTIFI
jgi:hypothetical protein